MTYVGRRSKDWGALPRIPRPEARTRIEDVGHRGQVAENHLQDLGRQTVNGHVADWEQSKTRGILLTIHVLGGGSDELAMQHAGYGEE